MIELLHNPEILKTINLLMLASLVGFGILKETVLSRVQVPSRTVSSGDEAISMSGMILGH